MDLADSFLGDAVDIHALVLSHLEQSDPWLWITFSIVVNSRLGKVWVRWYNHGLVTDFNIVGCDLCDLIIKCHFMELESNSAFVAHSIAGAVG